MIGPHEHSDDDAHRAGDSCWHRFPPCPSSTGWLSGWSRARSPAVGGARGRGPAPGHRAAEGSLPVQQTPVTGITGSSSGIHPAVRPPVPLPQQLGAPAFALVQTAADASVGTSTITVTVAPEDLGPISIRASFSPDGTRLEFFSATDTGREALKQALPDLRREASSSGLSASLDLGTGTPDDDRPTARTDSPLPAPPEQRPAASRTPWAGRPAPGSVTLDLFA
ncbi:hypothetical protein GM708_05475 [Vibrio cholerae]|nr:hypothetical protein [Vibrio cholerae]